MLLSIFLLMTLVSCHEFDFQTRDLDPEWDQYLTGQNSYKGPHIHRRFIANSAQDSVAQQCILPNGRAGHCRPLRQCMRADFNNNYLKFIDYACILNFSKVGVCCPNDYTRGGTEGLAGNLPIAASKEESYEAIQKVIRAENRGCGLSTRSQSRLFGTRATNPREWPWMASITTDVYERYCGGALITDRHVLTAAHCTRRWKAEELFVRLGEYDFKRNNDSRSYNFRVVEIWQHEDYEFANNKNDIAILKLHRQAVFNTYVWPICLPPPDLPLTGETVTVIGWGTQSFGGPVSNVLMEVSVPVWEHEKCVASYVDRVFNETLCAGRYEGGKDACQKDSGGPLMYQMASGRWALVGLVSWGLGCGQPNHPGLYVKVDSYLDWILLNTRF